MIRPATQDDITNLLALAEATGLFQTDELDDLNGMLSEHLSHGSEGENCWIADDEDGLVGAAYYAPEQFAEGVWNLYFIGVHPQQQGNGRGTALLSYVEKDLAARGERLLLVETSGLDNFELTRTFYRKNSYEEEARIRDFYKTGDDKIIFRKALTP